MVDIDAGGPGRGKNHFRQAGVRGGSVQFYIDRLYQFTSQYQS